MRNRIRDVVREYHDASVNEDVQRICGLLGPRVHAGMDGDCVAYVGEYYDGGFSKADFSELEELAESGSVTIRGNRAKVTTDAGFDLSLVELGGEWRVDRSDGR